MYLILNLVNLILCVAWGWSAMCRLSLIHKHVMVRYQVLYLGAFVSAWVCGLQFYIFGTYAGWPDVIASCVILALMLVDLRSWKDGPPCATLNCSMPLE